MQRLLILPGALLLLLTTVKAQSDELTPCRNKVTAKYGYCSSGGKVIIPQTYEHAGEFGTDGYAIVGKGGKYGVINRRGHLVEALVYDAIYTVEYDRTLYVFFRDAKAGVRRPGRSEDAVIPERYGYDSTYNPFNIDVEAHILPNALIPLSYEGRYGLFNMQGEQLTDFRYEYMRVITEYTDDEELYSKPVGVVVGSEGKYFIADFEGNMRNKRPADDYYGLVSTAFGLRVIFKYADKLLFLDPETGNVVDPDGPEHSQSIKVMRPDGRQGIVHTDGRIIVPVEHDKIVAPYVDAKNKRFYVVTTGGKSGIFDADGKVVLPQTYSAAGIVNGYPLKDHPDAGYFFKAAEGGKFALFNEQGERLTDYKYDKITGSYQQINVYIGEKHGILNPETQAVTWVE